MRFRHKTVLVALLAMFAVSAIAASAAAAAGDEYLWKVKGVQLGAGASKNIVSKNTTGSVFAWNWWQSIYYHLPETRRRRERQYKRQHRIGNGRNG